MKHSKRFTAFLAVFLSAVMLFSITAYAAYYNTYTAVLSPIPNDNSCYATQGFDVGSTYTYSVKISGDNSKANIYRTKMSDGTNTLMTNGDNGLSYCTYLGHANDLVLFTNNSEYYMFVVTMNAGSLSLVKLKYVSTTYYKVGNYTIKYNGNDQSMSGVKITGKDANNIYFLFKSGRTYYRGTLPLTANSGTINVSYGFYINTEDALVNGSTVPGIENFLNQGFGYEDNTLYHPVTQGNVSIILVYHNISTASGTIYADNNLSFRITSSAYPSAFEIEGCGIAPDGHLWFNCNRKTNSSDNNSDAVCYFNNYIA